jgi:hypothetical protein
MGLAGKIALLPSHYSSMSRQGARITKLGIFAALMLAAAGASYEVAWAADVIPTTASAMATIPRNSRRH